MDNDKLKTFNIGTISENLRRRKQKKKSSQKMFNIID